MSIRMSRPIADEPIAVGVNLNPSKVRTVRDLRTLRALLDEAIDAAGDLCE